MTIAAQASSNVQLDRRTEETLPVRDVERQYADRDQESPHESES
jgi:hypothetical protein